MSNEIMEDANSRLMDELQYMSEVITMFKYSLIFLSENQEYGELAKSSSAFSETLSRINRNLFQIHLDMTIKE